MYYFSMFAFPFQPQHKHFNVEISLKHRQCQWCQGSEVIKCRFHDSQVVCSVGGTAREICELVSFWRFPVEEMLHSLQRSIYSNVILLWKGNLLDWLTSWVVQLICGFLLNCHFTRMKVCSHNTFAFILCQKIVMNQLMYIFISLKYIGGAQATQYNSL